MLATKKGKRLQKDVGKPLDERFDSVTNPLYYALYVHEVRNIERFRMLYVITTSSCEHSNVHMN